MSRNLQNNESKYTFSLYKVMMTLDICYNTRQMTSTRGNCPCGKLGSVSQGRGNGQKPWELASQNKMVPFLAALIYVTTVT